MKVHPKVLNKLSSKHILHHILRIVKKFKVELIIFLFFVLLRLPDLGYDNFNTDVWRWKARSYDFGSGVFGLNIDKTVQIYHPGVTLLWVGALGIKTFNLYYDVVLGTPPIDNDVATIFALDFVQKLLLTLVLGAIFSSIYWVLKNLFGSLYANVFFVLTSFEPLYLGLTRVFHLEGLQSTLMVASFLWLYYYFVKSKSSTHLTLAGVFAGLALLTKTSAIFLLPFTFIFMYCETYLTHKAWFSTENIPYAYLSKTLVLTFKTYARWLAVVFATIVIVWPAVVIKPVLVFTTLYKGIFTIGLDEGHSQLYFNQLTLDPGWTFYFVVFAFKSSVALVIGLAGYLWLHKKIMYKYDAYKFALWVVIFVGLYLLELTLPSKKLDRYILPITLQLLLLATFFYVHVFNLVSKWVCKFSPLLVPFMARHSIYRLTSTTPPIRQTLMANQN